MFLEMAIVMTLLGDSHNPEAEQEQHCLIENAIFEAIGEGPIGMQLATEVAINRVDSNYRGADSFCKTVYDPYQFSWTAIPEEQRYPYTQEDYHQAAQVVLSVVYEEVDRILPSHIRHYLNRHTATDLSWYDPSKVVYEHRNHQFLAVR